ncbi:MAG TPA: preprotein translocase subunit YajC [Candidatus Paceibacterota bacterium]|nr:preprotein translocase subunit YajC [Candidatus Paceibacterota bacterium]
MDLSNLSVILGQATTQTAQNPQADLMRMIGTFVIFGAIFYFVLIRPQQKRAKQQAEMLKAIKRGDKVVTTGGIVGIVSAVREKTLTIKSDDAKLEITKGSVGEVLERSSESSSSES